MNPYLSPHTFQNRNSSYAKKNKTDFTDHDRILQNDYESSYEYQASEENRDTTVIHYGRRQLLLNEIEFLTITLNELKKEFDTDELKLKKILVIYGGASKGSHLLVLSEFFPFMKFLLYDKSRIELKFGDKNFRTNFTIKKEYLNKEIAATIKTEYSDEQNWIRLFISDIRRNNEEKVVQEDMDIQADIHRSLQPYKSHLKFRLPYQDKNNSKSNILKKNYLDGKIYFLVYGRRSTTETRLIVDRNAKEKIYDCAKYENQMYYFNNFDRTKCYYHDIEANGIDHCYDCRAEVFILENYIETFNSNSDLFTSSNVGTCKDYIDKINRTIRSFDLDIQYFLNNCEKPFNKIVKFTDLKYGIRIQDLVPGLSENFIMQFERLFLD